MRLFGMLSSGNVSASMMMMMMLMTTTWMRMDAFTAPHVTKMKPSITSLQGVKNPPPDATTPFKALVRRIAL
jgi:hypothetical protein